MRILFVHESLGIGGAEEMRRQAVRYLSKDLYEFEICCIEKIGQIGKEIQDLGITVACLHTSCKSYNLLATWRLFRYLRRRQFHVVQSSLFLCNLHTRIAALAARVPIMMIEEHSVADRFGKKFAFLYKWVDQLLARATFRIVCCSKAVRRSIDAVESIEPKKFRVVYNALDLSRFDDASTPGELSRLRQELRLDGHWPILGNVGSFVPWKGKEHLVAALKELLGVYPRARLVLVGDDDTPHGRLVRSKFQDAGLSESVIFAGQRRDVSAVVHLFDLYVSPSLFEAMPMSILEAMAAAVPVVATDVGGVSEVVSDGETGLLVAPGDGEALGKAAVSLLQNSARAVACGRAGRNRIMQRFTVEHYLAAMEEIYRDAARSLPLS